MKTPRTFLRLQRYYEMSECMLIPGYVKNILATLDGSGFEAYAVGGCVRDYLMGVQPKDYDIATSARPEQIKKLFRRTFDTGIKHGTITVVIGPNHVEVTTFRIDGKYNDNRRPDRVEFTEDLRQDLLRRDFTMNAIAYSPQTGYVDIYGGRADIENKIIRGVGDPGTRFREDALRMLRAIRFAGKLAFEIEPTTYAAILDNAALIKNISAERMRDELVKLLLSGAPEKISLVLETRLLEYMDAQFNMYLTQNLPQVLPAVKLSGDRLSYRLALLLRFMDLKQIKRLMTCFRFDNKSVKEVVLLVEWLNKDLPNDSAGVRKALSVTGVDAFGDVLRLHKAIALSGGLVPDTSVEKIFRRIVADGDCISLAQLNINGSDLIRLGFQKGEYLGDALNTLFNMVLRDPDMNSERLLKEEALRLLNATRKISHTV